MRKARPCRSPAPGPHLPTKKTLWGRGGWDCPHPMEGMAGLGVEFETPLPPGSVCALRSVYLLPPPDFSVSASSDPSCSPEESPVGTLNHTLMCVVPLVPFMLISSRKNTKTSEAGPRCDCTFGTGAVSRRLLLGLCARGQAACCLCSDCPPPPLYSPATMNTVSHDWVLRTCQAV